MSGKGLVTIKTLSPFSIFFLATLYSLQLINKNFLARDNLLALFSFIPLTRNTSMELSSKSLPLLSDFLFLS